MSELRPGLAAVRDLARSAQGAREAGELLDRICASVAGTFGFGRAGISRIHPETDRLELLAAHGISADEVRQLSSSLDDWQIFKRALQSRDLVFIEDVSAEHGLPPGVAEAYGVSGMLVLPLLSQDRCIGFLTADHGGQPFELDSNAAELLRTIGALVASFLESALAQEELRRLDEAKTNFIALASHELRTPAAVIYGIGATLQLRGDELSDQQVTDLRRVLYDHSSRLRQLVDQLLDLSRLEAKAIRIRPELIQVRGHVEKLVASLVPDQAAAIELVIPVELEAVSDVAAFDRIVSNLITNAFRYGDPPVRIQAERHDRHFRLAVEDSGTGVDPEFVPQLFERFTRSEESTKSAEGAGLGLSIAQSFARAQGGDLIYKPIEPTGARFEFVLPYPNHEADR
jgi:signal transduction histidine kinase